MLDLIVQKIILTMFGKLFQQIFVPLLSLIRKMGQNINWTILYIANESVNMKKWFEDKEMKLNFVL